MRMKKFRHAEPPVGHRQTSRSMATRSGYRSSFLAGLLVVTAGASGCHSAHVNATVSNRSTSTISVVQVEYPSASFGAQSIAPGQDFKYRFKVLGSGTLKITYTDTARVEHQFTGPVLNEGDDGAVVILVGAGKPDWNLKLASH